MNTTSRDSYDVIIIGAGIGGLVCGCYLAKAGMKVLVVEQHHKPGGYCTSFKRQGFTFDAAPHCFGSFRKGGVARKIFEDLEIDKNLSIIRPDPTDTIVTPDYNISFWNDFEKTLEQFQAAFPREKDNIHKFFHLLLNSDPHSFSKLRSFTFKETLDEYFTDYKLKAILSFPFLGIGGLPASMLSAFIGAKLYSEFLFDGGYYPQAGMQAIPDALSQRFKEFGGEMRLSTLVTKIIVKDNTVKGVMADHSFIASKYVVSDCDARQTFLKLLGRQLIEKDFYEMLKKMTPSLSNFLVYLGIQYSSDFPNPGTTFSFFSHYDIDRAYHAVKKGDYDLLGGCIFRIALNKSTMLVSMPAPFKNEAYWMKNKSYLSQKFIEIVQNYAVPNFSKNITFQEAATPHTLSRYTLNYKGASFGWAALPSQTIITSLRRPPFIKGLCLTGHWTTIGTGISGTAYVGQETATNILRKKNYQDKHK